MPDLVKRESPMKQLDANDIIKNMRRLRLPIDVPTNITLEEFVTKFVTQWSSKYATYYEHNDAEQTHAGARRSLGDITRLAQCYLPKEKVCLEKVKNILKKLLREERISTSICKQILKRVFFYRSNKSQTIVDLDERDEFGWTYNLDKESRVPKKFSRG